VHPFSGVHGLRVRSLDDRPLPLQVDGDYLGEVDEAEFGVTPRGIAVVS
jgi:diacylglycerol kinase family enzyme